MAYDNDDYDDEREQILKEKAQLREKKKRRNRMILFALVVGTVVSIGGLSIYWGVASYYKEMRANSLNTGIEYIEKGDFSRAVSYLKKSYDQGDLDALAFLSWLECSRGNYESAHSYARAATRQNIPSAFEVMGDLSILGYGQATGIEAAMSYFEQGAALYGPRASSFMQGVLDRALPLASNIEDYKKLVINAMRYEDPRAFLRIGDLLFLGDGVAVNAESAINNWQKAQILGINEANTRLAGAYFYGYGIEQNINKSLELYSKAAKGNDPIAYYSLALITLRNNSASESNRHEARELFKRAMLLNYSPAASALALLEGHDIDGLDDVALQRVVQSFKYGYNNRDETGALFYALMLASGTGVKKDFDAALAIIYDEHKLGSIAANDILKALSSNQDPKVLLKQAFTISHNVLLGEIIFFEGAPEASNIYHNDKVHGFELLNHLKGTNMVAAKIGNNFPRIIKDVSAYDVNGKLLVTPMLARIFVQAMPTTGARTFNYSPRTPTPKPPVTPASFENGRSIEVPDFSLYEIQ